MKILAVTACPTGVAHTNIAARALEKCAAKLGCEIKVERQGALGIQNRLTEQDIRDADVIIFASEQKIIGEKRFVKKPIYRVSVTAPIRDGIAVIKKAIELVR